MVPADSIGLSQSAEKCTTKFGIHFEQGLFKKKQLPFKQQLEK